MHPFLNQICGLRLLGLATTAIVLSACGGGGGGGTEGAAPQAATDSAAQATTDQQALAAAGASLPSAPAGISGNFSCRNQRIGAVTLDNVVVAADSACQLVGTTLTGTLEVEAGASVEASAIRSNGGVQAEGAALVSLGDNSSIAGSVQLRQGGAARIVASVIRGDLQIDALAGPVLASGNQVAGSLQATGNLGGLAIRDNLIAGNLQCSENLPAPEFSGNRAASADGQCAGAATGGGGDPSPPPVLSGNVSCVGLSIGAVLLDSVSVPAGATCTLRGTRLGGNLEIGAGAQLVADGIRVSGALVADGAASLSLSGASTVGGNVQISRSGAASLNGATVQGDLQIDAMTGRVSVAGNQVVGNLQAHANRGGLQLLANTFRGVMQCKDNLPAPTGSGNRASQKQDQCRGL